MPMLTDTCIKSRHVLCRTRQMLLSAIMIWCCMMGPLEAGSVSLSS